MNIERTIAFFFVLLFAAPMTWAQTIGTPCDPRADVGRPGLTCQATDDWEFRQPYIQNAKKGDVILSAGCGTIGGLLRQVDPPQQFSHSGVMTLNYAEVRHSTAAEQRYVDHAGSDGFAEAVLKYGWPGTITQRINEAYESHYAPDPLGRVYPLVSFNREEGSCPEDSAAIFPTVVKPPITDEVAVRDRLEQVAERAKEIRGHYRLFAYTDGAIVGKPEFQAPPAAGWAHVDAPEGTVCSELAWNAAHAAGVPVEDATVETGDRPHPPNPDRLGLFVYPSQQRLNAGTWLYERVYNAFYEEVGWGGELLTDAPDDAANQMANCFAFDWCGSEPGKEFDGEPDSKDSERWRNPGPGVGVAVAPDDIMAWDRPPAGSYGLPQQMVYRPGSYARVHAWERSAGTADVHVNVTYLGNPLSGARVILVGFPEVVTDAAGRAELIAIPGGRYAIDASSTIRDNGFDVALAHTGTVDVPSSGTHTVTVALTPDPAAFPTGTRWHRLVTVRGVIHIQDHETFGSNELDDHVVNASVVLDPVTKPEHRFTFSHCTGDEVRVETTVEVSLNAQQVAVLASLTGKLFEGPDCQTSDMEDEDTVHQTVLEGGSQYLTLSLVNGDWDGDDHGDIRLTVLNERAP